MSWLRRMFTGSNAQAQSGELARFCLQPLLEEGDNHLWQLNVGYLLDRLRTRDRQREQDIAGLSQLARGTGRASVVARSVLLLSGIPLPPDDTRLVPALDHRGLYNPAYHWNIVGHLAQDQLDEAALIYQQLLEARNLSAYANLAELERRRANPAAALAHARNGLDTAWELIRMGLGPLCQTEYWVPWFTCQLAVLEADADDPAADRILELADATQPDGLLRWLIDEDGLEARIPSAHRAASRAGARQRVRIRAALMLAGCELLPSPALGGEEELVQTRDVVERVLPSPSRWR